METNSVVSSAVTKRQTIVTKFQSMRSTVTVKLVNPSIDANIALRLARDAFDRVALTCTRFDPTSSLMLANAAGERWCSVPAECYLALLEAARGYYETKGLFDPRVLQSLQILGYNRTLPFIAGQVRLPIGPKKRLLLLSLPKSRGF